MKFNFSLQCVSALVLGFLFGLFVKSAYVEAIAPIGNAFIQLLQMIVLPLTFTLIVSSFAKLGDISHVKKLGYRTLFWFAVTAMIAAVVGLIVALWIDPGHGMSQSTAASAVKEAPSFKQIFLDMVPGNLIDQAARGKIIPIIIFAILFGLALTLIKEEAKSVASFFDGAAKVMFKITRWVIRLSPIGIFALIAQVSARYGLEGLLPFAKFILAVYLACFIQLLVYAVLVLAVIRVNPVRYFKAAWPMMITAFTTASSLGTLPVTMDTLIKRIGVPEEVASFVGPLSAAMKMDGCGAIYPAIVAIFTASIFQIPLDGGQYLVIVMVATVATIGTAGVPGTASVMAMVVLSSIGLPFTGLAMVIGIDKVVDMMRTAVNVTGGGLCNTLVAAGVKKEWKSQIQNQLNA
ncbi:MAG: dicarboxylate/amino acid:cation symporter [Gammaproteobacteria bacterium]|jgi:Na+/H+-dicarboxylate symporter|nr:dicarboxylate/amino acid:cation symporter [Gammaproteobacteria bacterium]